MCKKEAGTRQQARPLALPNQRLLVIGMFISWGLPELVREIKPEEMNIPITNKR